MPQACMALWFEFSDGQHTILPLQITLVGSRSRPFIMASERGLVAPLEPWNHLSPGRALQEKFEGFPLLQITDAHMLQPVPHYTRRNSAAGSRIDAELKSYWEDDDVYAPRTWANVWYLLGAIKPGMTMASPHYGVGFADGNERHAHHHGLSRWTRASALVEEVRHLNCTVV